MWVFLALAFALWTSIGLTIIKRLSLSIRPLNIILIGNAITFPFMLFLLILVGGVPEVTPKFYQLMFFSGVLDAIAIVASVSAIRLSPLSLISPIASFNPVFTTLIAMATLSEIPEAGKFFGIVLVVVGSYLLNIADIKGGLLTPFIRLFSHRGVRLFLLAHFLWAITPTLQKQAIFQTLPIQPLYAALFGFVLATFFLLPFGLSSVRKEMAPIRVNLHWFLILAPFSAIAAWAAFTAFSQAFVGYVTAIFKFSTLFTILIGWRFFREERIGERLLGASVMLVGTMLLVV